MIYNSTSEERIQTLINGNEKLSTGMAFLQLMEEQQILTGGVESAIVGGAVRDVFFHNQNPNDIDVFLYRARVAPLMSRNYVQYVRDIDFGRAREEILMWLEDQDIEHESLLSERAAEYFGGQRFLDILSFEWNGVNIQIMIPNGDMNTSPLGLDGLLDTMPTYSKLCLTLDTFASTNAGFASQFLEEKPLCITADIAYLRNKFPDERFIRFSNSGNLVTYVFGRSNTVTGRISDLGRTLDEVAPVPTNLSLLLPEVQRVLGENAAIGTYHPPENTRRFVGNGSSPAREASALWSAFESARSSANPRTVADHRSTQSRFSSMSAESFAVSSNPYSPWFGTR